jgi:8-oxo-dGTP diphosphatase
VGIKIPGTDLPGPVRREYPRGAIPSAHAITFREGKVLLVRRAHEPSKGRWSVPGGMIELGETLRDAAQRELREECGIEVEVDRVIDAADNVVLDEGGRIRFHYVVIYLLARNSRGDARPNSDASEIRWVGLDELGGLDIHPAAKEAVRRAFALV